MPGSALNRHEGGKMLFSNLFLQLLGDDVVELEADLLLVAAGARQDVVGNLAEIKDKTNLAGTPS